MAMLLWDVSFVIFIMLLAAACGWSVIAPFRDRLSFPLACSTLVGLLLIPCAALVVNVALLMPYWKALVLAVFGFLLVSVAVALQCGARGILKEIGATAIVGLVVAIAATFAAARTDVYLNESGFLYGIMGTDHLGYAHVADWIRLKVANTPMTQDPTDVYASWPDYMLTRDPRFGVVSLLAFISVVSGRSGAFAYDLTCAVLLTAASLGVAGTFARSRTAFVLLATSLLTSSWYDLGRMGFLGKVAGYPANLMALGLFFHFVRLSPADRSAPILAVGALASMVVCSVLVYSGSLTVLLLVCIGGAFVLLDWVFHWNVRKDWFSLRYASYASTLAGFAILGFISSGVVGRPLYQSTAGPHPDGTTWPVLFRWAAQVFDPPALHEAWLQFTVLPAVWVALGAIALWKKAPDAAALIFAPMSLLVALYVGNQGWRFEQTYALYIPAAFCAAALLLSSESTVRGGGAVWWIVLALFVVPIGLGFQRLPLMLAKFGGSSAPSYTRFALSDTERLAAAVGSSGVMVDTEDGARSLFLVLELGLRHIPFQLSERSWHKVMGYRPWPRPHYDQSAPLLIVNTSKTNDGSPNLVLRTAQYDLLHRP